MADTRDRAGGRVVDRRHRAAEDRAARDEGDEEAGEHDVDPEDGAAVHLEGDVLAGDVLADVADVLNGPGVGRPGHRPGLFIGEELLDRRRPAGLSPEGIDQIRIRQKEPGRH